LTYIQAEYDSLFGAQEDLVAIRAAVKLLRILLVLMEHFAPLLENLSWQTAARQLAWRVLAGGLYLHNCGLALFFLRFLCRAHKRLFISTSCLSQDCHAYLMMLLAFVFTTNQRKDCSGFDAELKDEREALAVRLAAALLA